jgi:TolB protein
MALVTRTLRLRFRLIALLALTASLFAFSNMVVYAQDPFGQIHTDKGESSIRIAAADFKPINADGATLAQKHIFDTVLYSDLQNAGIFDLVSKSMQPSVAPGYPTEINLAQWAAAPASASMVAFGNFVVQGGRLVVNGFLDDAKNSQFPQVFAKQYNEPAGDDSARQIAHRYADEIIFRLGGGINGIAESKIYYIKINGPNDKEVWEMDYDGANQRPITHLDTISMSPRISPDNSRLAFSALDSREGFTVKMYSLLLGRTVAFNGGSNSGAPAWTSDGSQLAFSSSRSGHPEIWVADTEGRIAHQITDFGSDTSPTWNPKTNAQIAFISGRSHLPQLYIMESDGSGVQRMTDGGYASSPSWSPNGQFIAFAWDRKYGPGAPGGQDIYVMEVASKRWIQLTHDEGRCDFPTWSPDGRHIAYASSAGGRAANSRIMTMLVDGTQKHALTGAGADMPNWSWK